MLIALWKKVMMHHLMQDIQAKLKNLSIKCHDAFGVHIRGFFAVTEVIPWVRAAALFSLLQKTNIVYSYQI